MTQNTLVFTSIDKTSELVAKVSLVPSTSGNSRTLCYTNQPNWVKSRDLSMLDLTQSEKGMNAIADMVAGKLVGTSKLFFSAPLEKLGYENGTGRMAYVRYDFDPAVDAFTVSLDGVDIFVTVRPEDVPARGYQHLHLDAGELYAKTWEQPYTREAGGHYWYCRAASAILGGINLSCSVGPRLMDNAQRIMAVVHSDNPAEANALRKFENRETGRFGREVVQTAAVLRAEGVTAPAISDLDVPLQGGGFVSLARYTKSTPIVLVTASGVRLNAKWLRDNTDLARLELAQTIRNLGALVVSGQ